MFQRIKTLKHTEVFPMKDATQTNAQIEQLLDAIASITCQDEARAFFRDLCTMSELGAMAERWQVVHLLDTGMTDRDIRDRTGASTATITRVAQWYNNGTGGYRLVLCKQKLISGKD